MIWRAARYERLKAARSESGKINARQPTRRETLLLGAATLVSSLAQNVEAGQNTERHGISAFGDLKYPPDFKHFDYVNPNAPKGGVFSHIGATRAFNQNFLTFNSLNTFILKGDGAQGMELTFASLMVRAEDEPDSLYGLAARAVQISPDGLTYRFLLRPGITFHDGSPITAHDVAFSLKILKDKGHPIRIANRSPARGPTVLTLLSPQDESGVRARRVGVDRGLACCPRQR